MVYVDMRGVKIYSQTMVLREFHLSLVTYVVVNGWLV
jgi:hypothetical protein